jgi:hypothetical protein
MTTEELQNWARLLRWIGLGVTAIGLLITFASHVVADKLLVVQRNDKLQAQERLKQSEADLRAAQQQAAQALHTATEIEKQQSPRVISNDQANEIAASLKGFAGQSYTAGLASAGNDVRPLWQRLNQILTDAGWIRVDPAGLAVGSPPAGVLVAPTPGLSLGIDPGSREALGPRVAALARSLNRIGIDTTLIFDRDPKETRMDVITIIIGPKP